ncbi:MAG: hypothetical protein WC022_01990 [Parcubacteria group bacterium]
MNNFENINTQNIEAENVEVHEKELNRKLEAIQLTYAEERYRKELEMGNDSVSFADFIEQNTGIISRLKTGYDRSLSDKLDDEDIFLENIKKEIDDMYAEKNERWQEKMLEVLDYAHNRLDPRKESWEGVERLGILHYTVSKAKKGLSEYGIGEMGDIMEIHIEEMYKQKDRSFTAQSFKQSLAGLAERIAKDHLCVSDIVAKSWMLDSNLTKYIGFETIKKTEDLDNFSTWWQFIDKDGQINKKRLDQLMKTGKPPFQVALTRINVEDFLRKYLPEECKGDVILKEYSPQAKAMREFREAFGVGFDSADPEGIVGLFSGSDLYAELYKNGDLDEVIDFLVEMKIKGYTHQQITNMKNERLDAISERLRKKIKFEEYVDKKIHIE